MKELVLVSIRFLILFFPKTQIRKDLNEVKR